jgi:hypothetical protein
VKLMKNPKTRKCRPTITPIATRPDAWLRALAGACLKEQRLSVALAALALLGDVLATGAFSSLQLDTSAKDGQLVERGSHETLLRSRGSYLDLVECFYA